MAMEDALIYAPSADENGSLTDVVISSTAPLIRLATTVAFSPLCVTVEGKGTLPGG